MAIAINTTVKDADGFETDVKKDVARQDTFVVPPEVIVRGQNSRVIEAADYEATVIKRAVSIAVNGQLQPAECRRDADKRLVLTLGFTRLDAVILWKNGFEYEGVKYHNPDAKLWVKVVDCTPEEAFIRGIKENLERRDTTDLQEARAQEMLRTTHKMTDTQIAKVYGYTNLNRVAALRKLTQLDGKTQQLVHARKLSLSAALLVLDLPEDERQKLIDGATDENGKVHGNLIKDLLRQIEELKAGGAEAKPKDAGGTGTEGGDDGGEGSGDDDEETPAPAKKNLKRNAKSLKEWIAEQITEDTQLSGDHLAFLNHLSGWMDGKGKFSTKKLTELFAQIGE